MTLTQWLLLPAFAHVTLVFAVGVRMGLARFGAARRGSVKLRDVAVDNSRCRPEDVRKLANNYQNQFEVPVLYYAGLALLLATGTRGLGAGWRCPGFSSQAASCIPWFIRAPTWSSAGFRYLCSDLPWWPPCGSGSAFVFS